MDQSIGSRIKILRSKEFLNLTQANFAEKIGLKATAVGLYESGDRNVREKILTDICREFNVNEMWLRTGEGEMFTENIDDAIEQLVVKYALSHLEKTFISEYVKLNCEHREAIQNYIKNVFSKVVSNDEIVTTKESLSQNEISDSDKIIYGVKNTI